MTHLAEALRLEEAVEVVAELVTADLAVAIDLVQFAGHCRDAAVVRVGGTQVNGPRHQRERRRAIPTLTHMDMIKTTASSPVPPCEGET